MFEALKSPCTITPMLIRAMCVCAAGLRLVAHSYSGVVCAGPYEWPIVVMHYF